MIEEGRTSSGRYGIVGPGREELEWGEEVVEAKAQPGPPFYDLLHKATRQGAAPPVDSQIPYEVAQVMDRARTQLSGRL